MRNEDPHRETQRQPRASEAGPPEAPSYTSERKLPARWQPKPVREVRSTAELAAPVREWPDYAAEAPLKGAASPAPVLEPPRTAHRVLAFCTAWGRTRGGIRALNTDLCEALANDGHEVFVRVAEPLTTDVPPNVKIIGPDDVSPGLSVYERSTSGPGRLPPDIGILIGHQPDTSMAALRARELRYPGAVLVRFTHEESDLRERAKGNPARGLELVAKQAFLAGRSDVEVGVGPRLAAQTRRLAAMSGRMDDPVFHELIPGCRVTPQPPLPGPGGPLRLLLFGRVNSPLKGARQAAEMVRHLTRDGGADIVLSVRGANPGTEAEVREQLSNVAAQEVHVQPHTADSAELLRDLQAAHLVIMPSRAEAFGLTPWEAMAAGIPVLLPDSSGAGRLLARELCFPGYLTRPSLVWQGYEQPAPIRRWSRAIAAVGADLPAAWRRARALQALLRPYTWENAARLLIADAEYARRAQLQDPRAG